jgi:NADH-quinone oxidoreductase subunit L
VSLAGGLSRRIDAVVEAGVVGVGIGGLGLAYAARQFDEANLDGLIAWFVKAIRTLGARARSLQTGFVSRELVVAAAGAAGVFILALAAR